MYALVAPGAGGSGLRMWLGFGVGQIYVLARLWVKLTFWASETACSGRLATPTTSSRAQPVARFPRRRRDLVRGSQPFDLKKRPSDSLARTDLA